MALRVWLPLNGNINNQGLSNCTVTNNGATINNGGKIGKTYLFDANDDYISIDSADMRNIFKGGSNPFTIAFWIYNTKTTGSRAVPFGDYGLTGTVGFNLEINSSAGNWNNDIRFYWNGNPDYRASGTALTTNAWVHLAIVYDGTKLDFYRNGILVNTRTGTLAAMNKTSGAFYLGRDSRTGGTAFGGCLNDFRVYDEALSLKQIKELSKGLVAHYKLDTARTLNNLKRNANYAPYNNFSSAGATCTVVKTGEKFNGADVWRMTYTPVESNLSHVHTTLHGHGVYTASATYKANTKYCYWTLCKLISHPDTIVGGTASNIGGWTEIPMEKYNKDWYIVGQYRSGAITADKSDSIFTSFKTPSAIAGTPIIIDFCCPHLVEGYDYIVPEFDYLGTTLSYESDSSGYGYHGIPYGTLTFNDNSPRYDGCTIFDNSYLHKIPSPLHANSDAFSISCWFYPTKNSAQALITDRKATGDGLSVFYLNGGIRFDTGSSYQWQVGNITLNAWNYVVVTWNKNAGNKKLYINGNLINTTTNYGTLANIGDVFSIGNSSANGAAGAGNQVYGSLSDFRIYATALSADDILTMYKNSGIIDNKGNVYAYEFKEE